MMAMTTRSSITVKARDWQATASLHEPYPLIPSFSPSGGEGARRAVEGDSDRFMVPMHAKKRKGTFHEPTVRSPGFSRSEPPNGGTANNRMQALLVGGSQDGFIVRKQV